MHLQPVNPYGREILYMQGDQRTTETVTHIGHFGSLELVLQFTCEAIGLPLKLTREIVHSNADDNGLDRRDD